MISFKSRDAKKVKDFDINLYKKGFTSVSTTLSPKGEEITTNEYFLYKEIYQIIHYPDRGVEVVYTEGNRRVFYNDDVGKSKALFEALNSAFTSWIDSNLN